MATGRATLSSVDNALRVVELLGRQPSVRVVDVAEHLSVGRSTAHRVLTALLARGFVVQDSHKVYMAGPAIERLRETRATGPRTTADVVLKHLTELADRVGESCHVAVLEGNGTRFIARAPADEPGFGASPGMLLPAHKTAIGMCLLAELSRESLHALYPRGLTGDRREARMTLPTLDRKIQLVRRNGYAKNLGESDQRVNAVATCLRRPSGRAFAGIAVSVATSNFDPQSVSDYVDELSVAARAVRAELADFGLTDGATI